MNQTWRFHHAETGVFLPGSMSLPDEQAAADNTPAGYVATTLEADPFTQRIDVASGGLVPYTPPPVVIVWDAASARAERDARMAASDWVTLRAIRTGTAIPTAWATYMQALADITEQPGFPESIAWPTPPTA